MSDIRGRDADSPHEPATMGISGYVVVPKSMIPAPPPSPEEERVREALKAAHACSSPREVKAVLALLDEEREACVEIARRAAGRAAAVSPSAVRMCHEIVDAIRARV